MNKGPQIEKSSIKLDLFSRYSFYFRKRVNKQGELIHLSNLWNKIKREIVSNGEWTLFICYIIIQKYRVHNPVEWFFIIFLKDNYLYVVLFEELSFSNKLILHYW